MADRGSPSRPEAHGLVSLVQTLLGGAALLLAGAAFVFLGSGPVIPSLGDLPGIPADGGPVAAATAATPESAEPDEDALRVNVRGPARLVPGRPAPLDVRVGDAAAALGAAQQRLLVTFDLELRREARGWVLIDPARLVTSAADLPREAITLTGLSSIPCGTSAGTLTVTARELALDGRSGTAAYELPEVACPDDEVPEAPDSLHLQQRVWDSGNGDWRAQVARLLAPAPSSTTSASGAPAPARRAGTGSATVTNHADAGSDEDADDDASPSEEPADADDEADEERGSDSVEARETDTESEAAPEEPAADETSAWEPAPDDDGDDTGSAGSDPDGQGGADDGSEKD